MTGQWLLWAQRNVHERGPQTGEVFFMNFGARDFVTSCYGGDVVPLRVVEDPEGPYWGWIDNEDWRAERHYRSNGGVPQMIQPYHGMFTMQFPYGPKVEEEHGRGRTVRLLVEDLTAVGLDDTTNCPVADVCDVCGADGPDLAVATGIAIGVFCFTACPNCEGLTPPIEGWSAAYGPDHAGHLGIDLDEMGALVEMEQQA